MARWCYAVNAVAALTYLGLVGWGYASKPSAGEFLAVFALIELLPYAMMAGLARCFSYSRVITTGVFFLSLAGAGLTLSLDYWMLAYVKKNDDAVPAGALLVIWFFLQLIAFIVLFIASCLWQSPDRRRDRLDSDEQQALRPLPLDRWRDVAPPAIPGGIAVRDQATADRPGLA